jgi:superfamily I DNA/RNA helicase
MSFADKYELKENYRNSGEITEYVNKRFGMDMYKIGLPGSVKESNLLSLGELEDNDRGAIIIADETILNQVDFGGINVNVRYYNVEGEIHKNCYNVLTVTQAKGLEFEKVVVIDKNMTRNQLYVACTRAIRDLAVVNLT